MEKNETEECEGHVEKRERRNEKMEGGKRDREEGIGKMRDKHANKVRKLSRLMVPNLFRSTAPMQVQISQFSHLSNLSKHTLRNSLFG